jgi:hypothetical protein
VLVERRYIVDSKATHHGETRAINKGEILIAPGVPDFPCDLEICRDYGFNGRYPVSQAIPKSLRGFAVNFCDGATSRFRSGRGRK